MEVENSEGRKFLICIVRTGEQYGLDACLTHESADPLVEVYDLTYANMGSFGPRGQFVSRYYARTLAEGVGGGIDLCGYEPTWKIDARAWAPVEALAKQIAVVKHPGTRRIG